MSNAFTVSRQRPDYAARTATPPTRLDPPRQKQLPILIRFAYFLAFGWWIGMSWFVVCVAVTLGAWIFAPDLVGRCWGALGPLTTLQRHDPFVTKRR